MNHIIHSHIFNVKFFVKSAKNSINSNYSRSIVAILPYVGIIVFFNNYNGVEWEFCAVYRGLDA
jgi:hypothetical protein